MAQAHLILHKSFCYQPGIQAPFTENEKWKEAGWTLFECVPFQIFVKNTVAVLPLKCIPMEQLNPIQPAAHMHPSTGSQVPLFWQKQFLWQLNP